MMIKNNSIFIYFLLNNNRLQVNLLLSDYDMFIYSI